jgi:hypothetical protein
MQLRKLMVPPPQCNIGTQVPLGLSKKDPLLRRRELLGSGEGSLAARLLAAVTDGASTLLHGKNSGELISEAMRGGSDGGPANLLVAHPTRNAALEAGSKPLAARWQREGTHSVSHLQLAAYNLLMLFCWLCGTGILQQADPDALALLHGAVVQLAARPLDANEGGHRTLLELAD